MTKTVFGMTVEMNEAKLDDATVKQIANLFINCEDHKLVVDTYADFANGDWENGWHTVNLTRVAKIMRPRLVTAITETFPHGKK